jgi:DNA-binding transcriptional LysR family regulator
MNLNGLNWDDLRIFLAVARSESLSKAGRLLNIDHSTVGRRISALEFTLATPVFEHDRSGYRLNAQGREMLAMVEAMEANVLALADALDDPASGPTGRVRIATMEGIASLYLSEKLVTLKRMHSNLTVELVTSPHDVRISQREADLFLGFFKPTASDLDVRKLGSFNLHLYANPEYLARKGIPRDKAALRDHVFVGYIADLIQLDAVRWLDEAIKTPEFSFYSSSMLAQMFSAAAGGGIVMLPSFARAQRFGLHPILADEVEVTREIWLSCHQYLQRLPRIRAVVSFLTQAIELDHPVWNAGASGQESRLA